MRAVRSQAPLDRRARSDAPYQPDKMRIAGADRQTIDVRSASGIAFVFMRRSLPLGLVLVFLVPRLVRPAVVAEAGAELEDFEGGYQPARWMFSSGAEFPGRKGSFERATEAAHEGQFGGKLTSDFTGGGKYVGAILQMPESGAGTTGEWSGLRLWLKRPEGNDFVIRYPEVIETGDSAGQRLVGGVCIQTPSFQDRRLR